MGIRTHFRAMASSPFLSVNSARFVEEKLGRAETATARERVAKTVYFILDVNRRSTLKRSVGRV